MSKFVIYTSHDEVLVTTRKNETQFLSDYSDRNFAEEYDREEIDDVGFSVQHQGFMLR